MPDSFPSLPDYPAILLDRILREHALQVVFQPIVDLRGRAVHGFEALVRGPERSPLHSPAALFDTARRQGRLAELDQHCVRGALEAFGRAKLPGLLFLNITQTLFDQGWLSQPQTLELIQRLGLEPSRIVLEVLEVDDLQVDTRAFDEARLLHNLGFALALDDLGQGFGRMRLWQRLRPRYLKIDREFIDGVADDPLKAAFVRSVLVMAEASQSWVIAEGVEQLRDLQALLVAGVSMAQGWALARPAAQPLVTLGPEIGQLIEAGAPRQPLHAVHRSIEQAALGLLRPVTPLLPTARLEDVLRRFDREPDLLSIPVVDAEGRALGILNRYVLADRLWRPHVRDLLGNKPCAQVMSADVLRLDAHSSLFEASKLLADASFRHAAEGVLVTQHGRYRGLLLVGDLLRLVADVQLQAARYANPLTGLPGNVPIDDHIDQRLEADVEFVVAYADLDHFKPFNDAFGYRLGDEVIQLLASVLQAAFNGVDDFVGHVGGDDFVIVASPAETVARLEQAQDRFALEAQRFFDGQTVAAGGYSGESRRGEEQFFPLPAVSIGVLPVAPRGFDSHCEVSGVLVELKKLAKRQPGRHLFVDRRGRGAGTRAAFDSHPLLLGSG